MRDLVHRRNHEVESGAAPGLFRALAAMAGYAEEAQTRQATPAAWEVTEVQLVGRP